MKLDLGCGTRKADGFIGVDIRAFEGVDVICNLAADAWPWKDETVEEARCSHFIEHLEPVERIHFVNELHRVMKRGATALIVAPHWASMRAYGDLTHKWPPVCEMWFSYLRRAWRDTEAPHANEAYTCDFDFTLGYNLHDAMGVRCNEYREFAVQWYKEAAQDIHATLTKR